MRGPWCAWPVQATQPGAGGHCLAKCQQCLPMPKITCFSSSYTKLLSAAAAAAPCFLPPLLPLGAAPPSAAAAAAAAESSRYTGPSMPYLGTNTIRPFDRTCGREQ